MRYVQFLFKGSKTYFFRKSMAPFVENDVSWRWLTEIKCGWHLFLSLSLYLPILHTLTISPSLCTHLALTRYCSIYFGLLANLYRATVLTFPNLTKSNKLMWFQYFKQPLHKLFGSISAWEAFFSLPLSNALLLSTNTNELSEVAASKELNVLMLTFPN